MRLIQRLSFEDVLITLILKDALSKFSSYIKATNSNQKKIIREHRKSFKSFFAYNHITYIIYTSLRKSNDKPWFLTHDGIIISNYGYLHRLADQIGIMLLNGYPDGALRLWRSFYEHAAILLLLIKEYNNESLFEKFISHDHQNVKKKAESHNKNYEVLKFPKFDDRVVANIESMTKKKNVVKIS